MAEVYISEIHYDNAGTDEGEAVEITGPAGVDLTGYSLVLYNGNGGAPYATTPLSGAIPDLADGVGVITVNYPVNGLQNGSPDGVALVDPDGGVLEFLSYEGVFVAVGGPADGMTSSDIGVTESSGTAPGESLQRVSDVWEGPVASSFGAVNAGGVVVNPPAFYRISDVQGLGDTSPLVGQPVTVEAIVVGDFQNGDADEARNLAGFFLQEEDTDSDGDARTSEGIFVFDGGSPATDVNIGDRVRVTGTVEEFFGETEISDITGITLLSSGHALPSPAEVQLPAAAVTTSQNGFAQPDLESYEGMRVVFSDALTINEMFQLDRFNEIKLVQGERPQQFTQYSTPNALDYQWHLELLGARQIIYDDGLSVQNAPIGNLDGFGPVFTTASDIRMGDTISGLTGVLDYKWAGNAASGSTWRVRAIRDGDNLFEKQNLRPSSPEAVGGTLKVASLNVLNFFATIDQGTQVTANGSDPRGADSAEELSRQTDKLVRAVTAIDADVLGLLELENDFAAGAPGNAIAYLVEALNTAAGSPEYDWIEPGTQFVGTDAISVGIIYRPARVNPVGQAAILDDPAFTDPNDTGLQRSRPALAQTFEETASYERFTLVVNHLKSKGASGLDADPSISPADVDAMDGQGYWNNTRAAAAQALADWLATDPTHSTDPDFLVVGDFNAYAMEDPVATLESNGYVDLAREFVAEQAHSYVFDGQTGTLDYAFAGASLLGQVSGVTEWHVNADEADAIDYNLDFGRDAAIFDGDSPARNSDHDPVVVGLALDSVPPRLHVRLNPKVLWPANHKYVRVHARVFARDNVDRSPDVKLLSVTSSDPDGGHGTRRKDKDIVILNDTTFLLRAERTDPRRGRVYTVTYEATDDAGNVRTATATVHVPANRGGHD